MIPFVEPLFTIHLTRGAYVVHRDGRDRALAAIESGDAHVAVAADVLGDGLYVQPVVLVTAHIVSIVENTPVAAGPVDATHGAPPAGERGGLHVVK